MGRKDVALALMALAVLVARGTATRAKATEIVGASGLAKERTTEAMTETDMAANGKGVWVMAGLSFHHVDALDLEDWRRTPKDGGVVWDEEAVEEWFAELSKEEGASATARFVTWDGETVELEVAGGLGIDAEASADAFMKEVDAGETVVTAEWNHECSWKGGKPTITGDCVEVDLTNQKVVLHKDGEEKTSTSCVTGTAGTSDTTPGVFKVSYKQSPATLRGKNADGSDYASPVTYWMPFNGGQGLHDATWRSEFGGDIYKWSGSHGCVNLPYSAAETIYSSITEGETVVVHE